MQVAKWGNSLAIRLPAALVEALKLKAGDEIEIVSASETRLEVRKDGARDEALKNLARLQWPLPQDYSFDRNEANER